MKLPDIRYVTIRKFAEISGYTEKAVRRKMESGMWRPGEIWLKAPDGRILIDIKGFEEWVDGPSYAKLPPSFVESPRVPHEPAPQPRQRSSKPIKDTVAEVLDRKAQRQREAKERR